MLIEDFDSDKVPDILSKIFGISIENLENKIAEEYNDGKKVSEESFIDYCNEILWDLEFSRDGADAVVDEDYEWVIIGKEIGSSYNDGVEEVKEDVEVVRKSIEALREKMEVSVPIKMYLGGLMNG
jgi:hypothetical protein